MKWYFIRHGNMTGDPHRHVRPPVQGCLSPVGEAQVKALGDRLKTVSFAAVFTSPLGRAVQTAQVLQRAAGVDIQVRDWLIEWRPAQQGPGEDDARYEEMLRAAALLPREQAWKTEAGEGALEMAARIVPGWIACLTELGVRAAHGGYLLDNANDTRDIAWVAHGGSLGVLLGFVLGIPFAPYMPIQFLETGVAVLSLVKHADIWYPALEVVPPGGVSCAWNNV